MAKKNYKYGRTYPLVKGPEYATRSMWLVPLETVKMPDGAIVHKHESLYGDGSSLAVETNTPFKIGHMKLFSVLLESLWSQSRGSSERLTVEAVYTALGAPYEKLRPDVKATTSYSEHSKDSLNAIKELLNPAQLRRVEEKKTSATAIRQNVKAFVDAMNSHSNEQEEVRIFNKKIELTVRGTLNRMGREDHRKAQRDMLFAELRTLQNILITAKDTSGAWVRYSILKPTKYDPEYDRITVEFTDEFLAHFGNKQYPIKYLSSQLRDALTSKISLALAEYLQIQGVSRQRNGTFGALTSVTQDELIRVLSLEDTVRPTNALARAFRDIKEVCGIEYEYHKGSRLYILTDKSKKITDTAKSGIEDAKIVE